MPVQDFIIFTFIISTHYVHFFNCLEIKLFTPTHLVASHWKTI